MILKLKRTPGVYIAGFMGSGKTTIGMRVADELGWPFADLDDDIVREQGCSISDIFDERGEAAFRQLERDALRKRVRSVQAGRPLVMALGGGAFVDPENYKLLCENGASVWLDCSIDRIRARIGDVSGRPLARDPKRFEDLYHARRAVYSQCEYRVMVDTDDPAVVTAAVLALPLFH
jgi:shikimate kinase